MSNLNINAASSASAASAAAAIGKAGSSHDASVNGKDATPVFSRSNDARKLPALASACLVNGRILNSSFLEEAMTGDLMRTVRDIQHGDPAKAKERLQTMANVKLDDFFKEKHIDPSLLNQLKQAIDTHKDPKAMLAAVYEVLDNTGASKLSSKLRPEAASAAA